MSSYLAGSHGTWQHQSNKVALFIHFFIFFFFKRYFLPHSKPNPLIKEIKREVKAVGLKAVKWATMEARSPTGGWDREEMGSSREALLGLVCVDPSACPYHHSAAVNERPRLVISSRGRMRDLKSSMQMQEQFPWYACITATLACIGCAYSWNIWYF